MDNRCPLCRADVGKRGFGHAVIARMEIDCPHCRKTVRLNVHKAETIVVALIFVTIMGVAALAYWRPSQGLVVFALGAALVASLALPLLERTYLRHWPRYVAMDPGAGS